MRNGLLLIASSFLLLPSCFKGKEPEVITDVSPLIESKEGVGLLHFRDHVEIFKRAFWAKPNSKDEILQAERKHWLKGDGQAKLWQWYLLVKPSEELRKRLVEQNVFSLQKVDQIPDLFSPPAWFVMPKEDVETVLTAPKGEMIVILHRDGRLFATGRGAGFRDAYVPPQENPEKQDYTLPTTPPLNSSVGEE